jgi:hypothetical protein
MELTGAWAAGPRNLPDATSPSVRVERLVRRVENKMDFDRFERNHNRAMRFGFLAVIVNAALGLGLLGTIIWVAAHFLKKIW